MKIDPGIPESVQPIIKEYLRLSEQRLVGLINASYAIGYIAFGEYALACLPGHWHPLF